MAQVILRGVGGEVGDIPLTASGEGLAEPMIIHDPRLPRDRQGARVAELLQSIDVALTLVDLADLGAQPAMHGESMLWLVRGEPAPEWRTFASAENLWSTLFGNPRIESVRCERWKYIRYFEHDPTERDKIPNKRQQVVTDHHRETCARWLTASFRRQQPEYEAHYDLENDTKRWNWPREKVVVTSSESCPASANGWSREPTVRWLTSR